MMHDWCIIENDVSFCDHHQISAKGPIAIHKYSFWMEFIKSIDWEKVKAIAPKATWIAAPLLGSWVTMLFGARNDKHWYKRLRKPSLTPPGWVFPIVWTALYLMLGYASYLVWQVIPGGGGCICSKEKILTFVRGPLGLFWAHMLLNYSWSFAFFKCHCLGLSFLICEALVISAGYLIYTVRIIDPVAAYWMVPYLAWITFASYLNLQIWLQNKSSKKPASDMLKKNR